MPLNILECQVSKMFDSDACPHPTAGDRGELPARPAKQGGHPVEQERGGVDQGGGLAARRGGDGAGADSNATTFEDGMVAREEKNSGGEESKDNNSANDTRPNTGATNFSDVAPEDEYEHIRLIYEITPKNLDDPWLLISLRV